MREESLIWCLRNQNWFTGPIIDMHGKKSCRAITAAYKGEDKYFISSFVAQGRRGDPALIFFRANEKRHAIVSSPHRLFIV